MKTQQAKTALMGVFFLFIIFCTPSMSQAAGLADSPWPCFRQNSQHTGQSQFKGFGCPILKWKYQTGAAIESSPAISSDGTIYVGSNDGYLYAIKPTGKLKWQYLTGDIVRSSPAIGSDGTVYVGSDDGSLYAIRPNGKLKWEYPTGFFAAAATAIGSDGTVYIVSYTGSASVLNAINLSGKLKWRHDTKSLSTPAIGSDGTLYFGCGHYLRAMHIDAATVLWDYRSELLVRTSPAIGSDGTVYFGSKNKRFKAVNQNGKLKWQALMEGDASSSPAISSDGTIYVGSNDGYLYAIKPTGKLKWQYLTGDIVRSSPAIGSDGTVYVGSDDGSLYAIRPNGKLKWEYLTEGGIESSPAIGSDGTVYVGSDDGYLYAFGIPVGEKNITGYVKDFSTNKALSQVTVSTICSDVKTDSTGSYSTYLPPGLLYDITFSKDGYQTVTINNIMVDEDEMKELDIYLPTSGPLDITTTSLPPGKTKVSYKNRVCVSGGTYPYAFSLDSGSLPPGLVLDSDFGSITGKPTSDGLYTFTIGVIDDSRVYKEREFNIQITEKLEFKTKSPLQRGTIDKDYSINFEVSGGTAPYSFSHIEGSLPPGLTLSSKGSLAGLPTVTGSYNFIVTVKDADSRAEDKSFDIEIIEPGSSGGGSCFIMTAY